MYVNAALVPYDPTAAGRAGARTLLANDANRVGVVSPLAAPGGLVRSKGPRLGAPSSIGTASAGSARRALSTWTALPYGGCHGRTIWSPVMTHRPFWRAISKTWYSATR